MHAPSLPGHSIFLLLVQLALLVGVARLGAEIAKRIGLPAVVGEMAGGIVLGPSLFGHYAPAAFAAIFPSQAEQVHLLDAFGTVGMCLLLLLTGLETDLRLLRNLGRAALIASVMGMALPFALGFGLGYLMPGSLPHRPRRTGCCSASSSPPPCPSRRCRSSPRSSSTSISPSETSGWSSCRPASSTTPSAG